MNFGQLTEFCTINMGQSPDSKTYNDKGEGMPFYQGNADFGEIHPKTRVWCSAPVKIAHEDDILLSVRAPIGAMNIAKEECCIGRGLASLTPKTVKCSQKYLYYALQSKIDTLTAQGTGSTFKAISKKVLEKTNIPMYSLDEQKNITDVLNKVDYAVVLRRKQIYWLDQLVKSRFVELFGEPIANTKGWKIERAEKHINLLSGFPFDSSQYTEYGIKICGGLIIMPQRINWDSCKYWSSIEGFEEYTLQEKDIVLALDRPWISEGFKIAMVDADELPALLIQRTARIRAVDINQCYLMYCFILGGFDNHCNVTGSLVPHISAKDIRSFPIMLPPIELQKRFAAFVEQVDKSKLAVQKSLDELETLKKSLMQQYFG